MPAQDLQKIAHRLRADVLEMTVAAGAGHVAGPLSSADLFALLYFGKVVDHTQDKIILSCGHYCPILYAALARSGTFPVQELKTFMQAGSRLPGHPERGSVPGVEVSSGPLGQGVSVAVGMALALRLKHGYTHKDSPRIYCVLSDGELQEGQVWEAFNLAVTRKLHNLIFVLDRNQIQIEHYVREVVITSEVSRLEAFGLHVLEANGNDLEELSQALTRAKQVQGGPAIVVMNTVAGHGVSFMEDRPEWHDRVPDKEQLAQAFTELGVAHE
jgi:transketolase